MNNGGCGEEDFYYEGECWNSSSVRIPCEVIFEIKLYKSSKELRAGPELENLVCLHLSQ